LASGFPIGYSTLATQNNSDTDPNTPGKGGLYKAPNIGRQFVDGLFGQQAGVASTAAGTHINLLGDPTLRLHVVKPVSSLTATASGSTVSLSWPAVTGENAVQGYYVYRGWGKNGPFKRVSGANPVTGTGATIQWQEIGVPKGIHTYMVRTVKLEGATAGENMASGRYYNLSGGVTATVDVANGNLWYLTVLRATGGTGSGGGPSSFTSLTSSSVSINSAGLDSSARAWAINNAPGVGPYAIAGHYLDSQNNPHAVRWYNGASPVLGTADKTYGYGINDSKMVTGQIDTAPTFGTIVRAFRWDPTATPAPLFTPLDPLSSGNFCTGSGINNGGTIVGSGKNSLGYYRAIRWQAGQNAATDLNTLLGVDFARQSYAFGVNHAGYIVGKSQYSTANSDYHAVVVRPDGLLNVNVGTVTADAVDLGTLGGNNSEAYKINNLHEIAGSSQISDGTWRGFVKKPGGSLVQINSSIAGGDVYLHGINDSGVAVSAYPYAIIWQEGMGSNGRNLQDYNQSAATFYIYGAEAINNHMTIAGWGWDGSGYRAFMMAPPEEVP
jgi:hypothetical protein